MTAGVVEPRYPSFKGIMAAKNKPVDECTAADLGLGADQVGWAGARQRSSRSRRPRPARPARRSRTTAAAFERIVAFLEQLKVICASAFTSELEIRRREADQMGLSKVWVFAEAEGDKPATSTLELLTKAREIGDTVEAVFVGANADALAGALGEHGATTVHAVDPRRRARRRDRCRGARRSSSRRTSPTSSCSRRPTTVATRWRGCR